MPKELFLGTQKENQAKFTVKRLQNKKRLNLYEEQSLKEAKTITRRLAIRQIAFATAGVTALASGGIIVDAVSKRERTASSSVNFKELQRYYGQEIPRHIVRELAHDLTIHNLSSLAQSGNFVAENLQNPSSSKKYDPVIFVKQDKPITIRFSELGTDIAMYVDSGTLVATELELKNKLSGEKVSFVGVVAETNVLTIHLNQGLLDVGASPWVIRLMIAKEASHVFYFTQARELMIKELQAIYDFPHTPSFEALLVASAMTAKDRRFRIPFLTNAFYNFDMLIDYAGFGHIALDLANIQAHGLLSYNDKEILSYNLLGLTIALGRGLIIKDAAPNRFKWADGVSPFSQAWFEVMEEVHKRKGTIGTRSVYQPLA